MAKHFHWLKKNMQLPNPVLLLARPEDGDGLTSPSNSPWLDCHVTVEQTTQGVSEQHVCRSADWRAKQILACFKYHHRETRPLNVTATVSIITGKQDN